MNLRHDRACVLGAFALLSAAASGCAHPGAVEPGPKVITTTTPPAASSHEPISRTLLRQMDIPALPGWETRVYLIEYGPGVSAPLHHHPVDGLGYVIHGSFESAFENETPAIVQQGESFTDPALKQHTLFRNADAAEPLSFVMIYTVQKDAPVVIVP
jgi:quercetin dioxygenase-like cupin family protein